VRPAEHGQLQRELNALYRDRLKLKVHALACGAHGAEGMWFKKPVNTPVELKALRLRTVGISHVLAEKLGMKPNAIYEPAKTIEALEGGALDATEFGQPWYDEGLRFHRVARHFYYPGWHAPAYMWQLEINLDRWNEMSQAQKGLIGEACRQNIAQAVREYAANAKAALDRLKARKVHVHTFSKDILDAVRSARDGLIQEFSAKDPDFKRAWESYSSFR